MSYLKNKMIFLLLAVLAAAAMSLIGLAVALRSIIGVLLAIVLLCGIMGYGFATKKRFREAGRL
ncbi:MAG: DUF5325 family protein [Bacillus sp. (in: firmicutes)]